MAAVVVFDRENLSMVAIGEYDAEEIVGHLWDAV
jgi:hypothetical protein